MRAGLARVGEGRGGGGGVLAPGPPGSPLNPARRCVRPPVTPTGRASRPGPASGLPPRPPARRQEAGSTGRHANWDMWFHPEEVDSSTSNAGGGPPACSGPSLPTRGPAPRAGARRPRPLSRRPRQERPCPWSRRRRWPPSACWGCWVSTRGAGSRCQCAPGLAPRPASPSLEAPCRSPAPGPGPPPALVGAPGSRARHGTGPRTSLPRGASLPGAQGPGSTPRAGTSPAPAAGCRWQGAEAGAPPPRALSGGRRGAPRPGPRPRRPLWKQPGCLRAGRGPGGGWATGSGLRPAGGPARASEWEHVHPGGDPEALPPRLPSAQSGGRAGGG